MGLSPSTNEERLKEINKEISDLIIQNKNIMGLLVPTKEERLEAYNKALSDLTNERSANEKSIKSLQYSLECQLFMNQYEQQDMKRQIDLLESVVTILTRRINRITVELELQNQK